MIYLIEIRRFPGNRYYLTYKQYICDEDVCGFLGLSEYQYVEYCKTNFDAQWCVTDGLMFTKENTIKAKEWADSLLVLNKLGGNNNAI